MASKKAIISVTAIITSLVIFYFTFLNPVSRLNESFPGVSTPTQDPYLQEYSLPSGTAPNGLIVDKQGVVWVTSSKSNILYSFNPDSGILKDYVIKDNNPQGTPTYQNSSMVWTVAQDKGGYIWFSPLGTKSIWRFDPVNGTFHKFQSEAGSAFQMKIDMKTDTVWFTTLSGNALGVIERYGQDPSGYKMNVLDLGNGTAPAGIFLKNNSVWITEITTQKIIQYEIVKKGDFVNDIKKTTEFPIGNKTVLSSPTDLLVGNNDVWLTEHGTSFLTEYNLGSNNIVRFPTSQNNFQATTLPFWIRGINDGRDLWFNEHQGNKLAYFDTLNKTMTEYNIPSRPKDGYLTYPLNIATDPNDNKVLWFSEWNTDKIGRINGNMQIPFSISTDARKVVLNTDASKETAINIEVDGQSPYGMNHVFLNASSSVTPTAGFGNIDVKILPNVLDLSSDHKSQLFLRNYAVTPGNYTLGISASDGFVVKTIFLDLTVPNR